MITYIKLLAVKMDLSPLPGVDKDKDYGQTIWNNGLNIALTILAAVAVLMIVINGLLYITASGDPQKMANARHGIIYSLVGLAVVLLAAVIVTFAVRGIG